MSTQINVPSHRRVGRALPYAGARDEWGGQPGNETFSRTIHIDYAGDTAWRTLLPAQDSPLTGAAFLLFQTYQLRQLQEDGRHAELVLNYGQEELEFDPDDEDVDPEDPAFGFPTLPDDVISESDAEIQIDLRAHPKWAEENGAWGGSMKDFWDPIRQEFPSLPRDDGSWGNAAQSIAPAALWGRTRFLVGAYSVSITEYSFGRPTNVQGLVGRRIVPPGYTGTSANWLVLSGYRTKQGGLWTRTIVYQFTDTTTAANQFFEWIYST